MSEIDELLECDEEIISKDITSKSGKDDLSFAFLDVSKIKQIDPYSIAVINEKGEIVRTLSNDDLKIKSQVLIDFMLNDLKYQPKFYNAHNLLKDIVEVKKAFFPEASKQLNIDVTNVFEEQLDKWKKERAKIVTIQEVEQEVKQAEKEAINKC